MENRGCLGVFSPTLVLCIIFIFLKVFEVVDWSWWIVFCPLWLPFVGILCIWVVAVIFLAIVKIILELL